VAPWDISVAKQTRRTNEAELYTYCNVYREAS